MNKNLLILGFGQYGRLAKEIAEAMGYFEKIDFLDDSSEAAAGKLSEYERFSELYSYAAVAIGNSELRLKWIQRLEETGFRIAILVHPKAYISQSAQVMKGSIVEPSAVVNTGSVIGCGCIISAGAVVNHNAVCADGVHVDCNATVASNTLVPRGMHIQSNSLYKNDSIKAEDLLFSKSRSKKHGALPANGVEYCFEGGM